MTLYRFHGRITVEREESLSHLLYERMSIMYKVELKFDTSKICLWFHSPELYGCYDTYAKMKRYRKEWNGVSRQNLYEGGNSNGF